MFQTEQLQEKWQPVLEHPDLNKIEDSYKRAVTTLILENQEKAMREDASFLSEAAPVNATNNAAGGVQNWDPILISLVRRAMPNLMVLMPRQNFPTFFLRKFLLKSTVKLFVLCMSRLCRVLR
jgi:hypothetical protein